MHTTTTSHEKAYGCDPVGFQNDITTDLNFRTAEREGKAFAMLAARFALAGHTLTRSNPADGAAMYYAGRWGLSRALPDLQAAAHFLAQIGSGA
jgi:hypothetical protein